MHRGVDAGVDVARVRRCVQPRCGCASDDFRLSRGRLGRALLRRERTGPHPKLPSTPPDPSPVRPAPTLRGLVQLDPILLRHGQEALLGGAHPLAAHIVPILAVDLRQGARQGWASGRGLQGEAGWLASGAPAPLLPWGCWPAGPAEAPAVASPRRCRPRAGCRARGCRPRRRPAPAGTARPGRRAPGAWEGGGRGGDMVAGKTRAGAKNYGTALLRALRWAVGWSASGGQHAVKRGLAAIWLGSGAVRQRQRASLRTSSTTTLCPARSRFRAAVRPEMPPPTTTTSTPARGPEPLVAPGEQRDRGLGRVARWLRVFAGNNATQASLPSFAADMLSSFRQDTALSQPGPAFGHFCCCGCISVTAEARLLACQEQLAGALRCCQAPDLRAGVHMHSLGLGVSTTVSHPCLLCNCAACGRLNRQHDSRHYQKLAQQPRLAASGLAPPPPQPTPRQKAWAFLHRFPLSDAAFFHAEPPACQGFSSGPPLTTLTPGLAGYHRVHQRSTTSPNIRRRQCSRRLTVVGNWSNHSKVLREPATSALKTV